MLLPLLLAACTSLSPAPGPIDWAEVDDWSVHVVTRDSDGDLRVARIWLVVVDGQAAIRTQDSRWFANIQRGSDCWIRRSGGDHPVNVELVSEMSERKRIDAAFLEKYGWQESVIIEDDRAETDNPYMRLSAKAP